MLFRSWFVARKTMATNTLHVVQGHGHPWLQSTLVAAGGVSWVAGRPPDGTSLAAKTRYRQTDARCELDAAAVDRFTLRFQAPQWAVTPGQSAVVYDGEVCLGGGFIDGASP